MPDGGVPSVRSVARLPRNGYNGGPWLWTIDDFRFRAAAGTDRAVSGRCRAHRQPAAGAGALRAPRIWHFRGVCRNCSTRATFPGVQPDAGGEGAAVRREGHRRQDRVADRAGARDAHHRALAHIRASHAPATRDCHAAHRRGHDGGRGAAGWALYPCRALRRHGAVGVRTDGSARRTTAAALHRTHADAGGRCALPDGLRAHARCRIRRRRRRACISTMPLLEAALRAMAWHTAFLTLHVGAGTFPSRCAVERIEEHVMHSEWYDITPETVPRRSRRRRQRGGKVIAVGTASVRARWRVRPCDCAAPRRTCWRRGPARRRGSSLRPRVRGTRWWTG